MSESLAVRPAVTSIDSACLKPASHRPSTAITRVNQVLDAFAQRDPLGEVLTAIRQFPAREAQFAEFPTWADTNLIAAYGAKGIRKPYTHQAAAAELAHAGKNIVIVTPTASGKTLCYNLPILNEILESPDTRALYLFPTKAPAQD